MKTVPEFPGRFFNKELLQKFDLYGSVFRGITCR